LTCATDASRDTISGSCPNPRPSRDFNQLRLCYLDFLPTTVECAQPCPPAYNRRMTEARSALAEMRQVAFPKSPLAICGVRRTGVESISMLHFLPFGVSSPYTMLWHPGPPLRSRKCGFPVHSTEGGLSGGRYPTSFPNSNRTSLRCNIRTSHPISKPSSLRPSLRSSNLSSHRPGKRPSHPSSHRSNYPSSSPPSFPPSFPSSFPPSFPASFPSSFPSQLYTAHCYFHRI